MKLISPPTRPGYWLAQLLVWGAYAGLNGVFAVLFGNRQPIGAAVAIGLSIALLWSSHVLRMFIHSGGWLERGIVGLAWRLLIAAVLFAIVVQLIGASLLTATVGTASLGHLLSDSATARVLLMYTINTTIILMMWSLAYVGFKTFERWRVGEIDRWRTQAMLREAELNLLKAQLDPHFIFNALNNIRAVILEDPGRARDMLTHLSQSLRHMLQHSQRDLVSLRDELAAVDDYLALIDLHTDGALLVKRSIDPNALDTRVPPLAVQLLIENAVKHGAKERGGELGLAVSRSPSHVTIEVSNPGRLLSSGGDVGVGLPNLRERLQRAFGGTASCDVSEQADRVYARLSVPH